MERHRLACGEDKRAVLKMCEVSRLQLNGDRHLVDSRVPALIAGAHGAMDGAYEKDEGAKMLTRFLLQFAVSGAEWVLWVLVILSFINVAIMIERAVFLFRRSVDVHALRTSLEKLFREREFTKAAKVLADVDAMAHAVLQAHWRDDADLSDEATLAALAETLGHSSRTLMAQAETPEVTAQYAANAEAALNASVLGSPTYVLEEEVFYGQDRLELLERAITQPFAKSRWINPTVDAS